MTPIYFICNINYFRSFSVYVLNFTELIYEVVTEGARIDHNHPEGEWKNRHRERYIYKNNSGQ